MTKLAHEAVTLLWKQYKTEGGADRRNEIALHYASLVRYVASKLANTLHSAVDREDLVSCGQIGLFDAIEKFDLEKGVKFETYAVPRIKGSIIDQLRAQDWVPRSVRSKAREIDRVQTDFEMELGRMPEDGEIAERLGISIPEVWSLLSQASVTQLTTLDAEFSEDGRQSVGNATFDPASNPEDLFASHEITELIADAVNDMPERSKTILVLYYLHEMTLAEIGEVLGVTESRVCQLQSKVLQSLGSALTDGAMTAA